MRKLLFGIAVAMAAAGLAPPPAGAVAPPVPVLLDAALAGAGSDFTTGVVRAPSGFDLAGLSYEGPAGAEVELRASSDGVTFTPWTHLADATAEGPDHSSPERRPGRVTAPVWTGGARYVQARVHSPAGPVGRLRLRAVDVRGRDEALASKVARHLRGLVGAGPAVGSGAARPAGALADAPAIVTRPAWGADESLRRSHPHYGKVRVAFLHHTVSANTYSRDEAPGLVRAIHAYHVQANGWDDIGYNFLVDRFGTVYEGRAGGVDRAVIGAHAAGFNASSTGVALLGTHTSSSPSAEALAALHRLLAWRLDVAHVDPTATVRVRSAGSDRWPEGADVSLAAVSGHRDVSATSCPGELAYRQLASIRAAVDGIGRPKLYDLAAEPATAAGDPVSGYDPITIRARATDPMAWSVAVAHPDLGDVRRLAAVPGTQLEVAWDGRNDAGLPVPAGRYAVRIEATSLAGPVRGGEVPVTLTPADPDPVVRLGGADRYATAAAAARQVAPSATEVVVTAGSSRHLVDALVAAPLARARVAPLLLAAGGVLPAETAAELDRLRPAVAWIVGGAAAVPEAVADALRARGAEVRRLAGADAASTAAAVAGALGPAATGGGRGAVVVSRERASLVDGLAASGAAAGLGRPVLLVGRDEVPAATAAALGGGAGGSGGEVWAVGGTAAVSDAVVAAVGGRRVAGGDRWATAAAVAVAAAGAGLSPDSFVVASGDDGHLVDALAGGAFGEALLLTEADRLPAPAREVLAGAASTAESAWVMGGTAAVSDEVLDEVQAAISQS